MKGHFKIVSRKVRTLTASCLNLILRKSTVNVLATCMCAYCTKRPKDIRLHLVLIHDVNAVVRSCLWLQLLLVYILCLPCIPAVYHRNRSFSWICPVPEHHLSYCGVLQEHVRSFTTLEVLLYLCRWNWPFVRSLLELGCILLTRTTSAGSAPLAGVARLTTLSCELLTTPSIILYLGKRILVLQGHLQEGQ